MKSNQQNLGTLKSSNLCVAPETVILTDKGHIEIQELEGQNVRVWNGEEFSSVDVVKTGTDQELIDVYTDDGSKLTCTPYHKFYIQESYLKSSIKMVDAQDLKPNDKLMKSDYPIIDGQDTFLYPYTHGFFCGDGTYTNVHEDGEQPCKFAALEGHYFCKRHLDYENDEYLLNADKDPCEVEKCQAMSYAKKPMAYLYGEKKELLQHMIYRSYGENGGRLVLQLPLDISEKFYVPSFNCSLKDKMDWFAGYCDADGTISRNGDNEQLQVASINYEFLQHVKLFLQTCGINPKIRLSREKGQSYLPDGKGGHKYFDTQHCYRLLITSCDLYTLVENGFSPKRLKIAGVKPARDAKQFIKILRVENNNRIDDTYCFTEPKRHMGVFNGILTGQCSEITQYSDDKETAVCNLASIGLPTFVENGIFNYDKLHEVVKVIVKNLNNVIDVNFYPTDKTKLSNMRNRPVGIGVQGLADCFVLMDLAFHSDAAKEVNKKIFETIYHAALERSWELAIRDGAYETFAGSPASKGILQFDMWSVAPSDRYDWTKLKAAIVRDGLRNSLLVAPMPTASTSQILGFNECFEPFTSNIYSRRTLAGEFVVINKYLVKELIDSGHWNEQVKNNIVANFGSIQQLDFLSDHMKQKYKIVWEIPMKHVIDMAADRGAFICQSQSMNLWVEDPTYNTLTSMHFYSWKKGLKTGIYYLRRKAKHQAQQFTIEPEKKSGVEEEEHDEICEMCSG
jgi:ribonucleoside-diphosphate reductase alpha chain